MVPFFDFAIGLKMLDSSQDMLNIILLQELFESGLRVSIFVVLLAKNCVP